MSETRIVFHKFLNAFWSIYVLKSVQNIDGFEFRTKCVWIAFCYKILKFFYTGCWLLNLLREWIVIMVDG